MEAPNTCFCCGGSWHDATGDFDRQWNVAYCHPCVERRKKWHLGQLNRGVAGDGQREEGYQGFYAAAETSIRPGTTGEGSGFTKFVQAPNQKARDKVSKRKGRWRAGPDLVRKPQGPEPWREFRWVSAREPK